MDIKKLEVVVWALITKSFVCEPKEFELRTLRSFFKNSVK